MDKLGKEPAFATSAQLDGEAIYEAGMSKRFYAACAAMQGLCANKIYGGNYLPIVVVEKAYKYADELLRQEYGGS